ncbi:MAG: site-2 protease family protein [Deltaproteobacteria bacterium]|nr:site-2 protease family protein [Deltaproteobacteria bacterium]
MFRLERGSIRLFRLGGIVVFLHWSWLIVAMLEIQGRQDEYRSIVWNVAEYLSLFAIVLLHEFGHSLACRSVGGKAERIVLWPLGGVAFVSPPPRPGAVLWSIAAGPLVNLVLAPATMIAAVLATGGGVSPDVAHFFQMLALINVVLLAYNSLPIYPLDGGQILQAILWFFVGRARSLAVAATIGLVGAAGIFVLALVVHEGWLIVLAVFGALRAWAGMKQARQMSAILSADKHVGIACPACGVAPPVGPFWRCMCGASIDPFASHGACEACGRTFSDTSCPDCNRSSAIADWDRGRQQPAVSS